MKAKVSKETTLAGCWAKLDAEYGGEGALLGGLIGAGFGAAPSLFKGAVEIVVPKVKNNKMVGWGTKKIKNWRESTC